MIKPRTGEDVNYVLKAADGSRPAIIRPAKVITVNTCTQNECSVNVHVFIDGGNDAEYVGSDYAPGMLTIWRTSVKFDSNKKLENTFFYPVAETRIENMRITRMIEHGREVIRQDAIGVWDQEANTLTFDRDDVANLAESFEPVYEADRFIDLHCARMEMPEGYTVAVVPGSSLPRDPNAPDRESADERRQYLDEILDEWTKDGQLTRWPTSIRRTWGRGDMLRRALEDRRKHVINREVGSTGDKKELPASPPAPTSTKIPLSLDNNNTDKQSERTDQGDMSESREVAALD